MVYADHFLLISLPLHTVNW